MSSHAYHTRPQPPQRPTVPPSGRSRWLDRFGLRVLRQRWNNAMPKFFRVICWSCALVSGTALAVNTAIVAGGGIPHEWWSDIYPYLLGIPAGMAFVAKFTQNYDRNGNPINKPTISDRSRSETPPPMPDRYRSASPPTVPDGSPVGTPANDSDIETSQPIEIEPYNDF